jgi:hypothetical protein
VRFAAELKVSEEGFVTGYPCPQREDIVCPWDDLGPKTPLGIL